MNEARAPHPVPLSKLAMASLQRGVSAFASECGWGEGTVWHAPSVIQASVLHLHPLADADRKMASLPRRTCWEKDRMRSGTFIQRAPGVKRACAWRVRSWPAHSLPGAPNKKGRAIALPAGSSQTGEAIFSTIPEVERDRRASNSSGPRSATAAGLRRRSYRQLRWSARA